MLDNIYFSLGLTVVIGLVVQIESVTVNPLCPTNKIAPRRRVTRFETNPRTFGAFYNLLTPGSNDDVPSSLQETPQADEPDDCGDIEDYDENDLSSVMPYSSRRQGQSNKRFHGYHGSHYFIPPVLSFNHGTHTRPTIPPKKPTRPPTGGYFGTNSYTPPRPQEPSDHIKPVHEAGYSHEPQMTYRPGIVGTLSGHVVGLPQVKPTRHLPDSTTHKHYNHNHINTSTQSNTNTQKYVRPRRLNNDGLLGSFLDLFLK